VQNIPMKAALNESISEIIITDSSLSR